MEKKDYQAQVHDKMTKKFLLFFVLSASAFSVYVGVYTFTNAHLAKREYREISKQINSNPVNGTYSTKHRYGESLVITANRLPNTTTVFSRFTQLRIQKITKFFFKSWDNVITPYITNYVIDGCDICKSLSPPFLLAFVLSLPINTMQRQTIRRTWGSFASQNTSFNLSVRLVFMLGRMTDGTTSDRLVRNESIEYKDIVQLDFMESRYNLTRKMMYGLKWVKTYCSNIKYILKVDDDTFINTARLSEYLLKEQNINNNTIHGFLYRYGGPVLRKGKYAVKKDELPISRYPPYVSGTSYILPYDVVPDMLDLAERLPYCPVDDAFMTGVMRDILDIKVHHSMAFTHMYERTINPCAFLNKIAVTNINTNCMIVLWNLTTHARTINCTQYRFYGNNKCLIFK